jgi:heat shock protein HslJ
MATRISCAITAGLRYYPGTPDRYCTQTTREGISMKTFILLMFIVCASGCTAAPEQKPGGNDGTLSGRQIPPGGSGSGLENVAWQLREYLGESGKMLAVQPETSVDARFSDGRIDGSAGCNRYFGNYTGGENNRLTFAPGMAATRMACPPAITRQEQRYLALLAVVASWQRRNDILQLLNKDREPVLEYVSARAATLAGSSWQASGINNGRGGVVSGKHTHLATATFTNATISGSAGCNRFTATYQVEGDRLGIGPAATTRKHCAEPDGIMQQEQEYLDALARVRTYTLKTDSLELRDGNGSLLVNYRLQSD